MQWGLFSKTMWKTCPSIRTVLKASQPLQNDWLYCQNLAWPDTGRGFLPPLGARTEKSRDFAERPLFALSDGAFSQRADVVEWTARTGACGLTSVAVPLTAMKASTIFLNRILAATGSQWRSRRRGVMWENLGRLKTRHAAAFWIHCNGLVVEAVSLAKSDLQQSRWEMTGAWTRSCIPSFVMKDQILRMLSSYSRTYLALMWWKRLLAMEVALAFLPTPPAPSLHCVQHFQPLWCYKTKLHGLSHFPDYLQT